MHIVESVRRLAAPVAGLLGAAAICVACSSSTGGTPASTGSAPAGSSDSSSSSGSLPTSPSLTLPTLTGVPSIGGDEASSDFCKDFTSFDPTSVSGDPNKALTLFDKIADDAPAAIKADAETVRDFIHSAVGGNPDTSHMQDYQQAITNLTSYYAAHCAGG